MKFCYKKTKMSLEKIVFRNLLNERKYFQIGNHNYNMKWQNGYGRVMKMVKKNKQHNELVNCKENQTNSKGAGKR